MRRRAILMATLIAGAGGLTALALAGRAGPGRAQTTGTGARDRYLGRVAPDMRIFFGLALRMRSPALERYAAAVGAGTRPPLTAAQIGAHFGVSTAALAHLRRLLEAHGVRVIETFRQRTEILLSAPAPRVERMLGTTLGEFADAQGGEYHRPLAQPAIPPALRSTVLAATLLDSKRIAASEALPENGLTGTDLALLYDVQPLINQGLDGAGQTVAVYSEDDFLETDIKKFELLHNIVGSPPIQRNGRVKFVTGAVGKPEWNAAAEVDLDLEVIRSLAPRAKIINYEINAGLTSMFVGINRIINDEQAKLVDVSYGLCELYFKQQPLRELDTGILGSAEAHGVTFFVSSGDQGAYECQRHELKNHQLSVPWPGSSPHVVSVGGTHVDLRSDGTRLDELGWEHVLSHGGGGGGVSTVFPRPDWQTGVKGIDNMYTTNPPRRQVPDVAAAAAPSSGYGIYTSGQPAIMGGTSGAAPFWTASFALIEQLAQRKLGHPLPFIGRLLYRAAARNPGSFYDVTLGGNRFYRAGPGWDYSTGLGAPDMAVLAQELIASSAKSVGGCRNITLSNPEVSALSRAWRVSRRLSAPLRLVATGSGAGHPLGGQCGPTEWAYANFDALPGARVSPEDQVRLQDGPDIFKRRVGGQWRDVSDTGGGVPCSGPTGLPRALVAIWGLKCSG